MPRVPAAEHRGMRATSPALPRVTLAGKVAALRETVAYPEPVTRVEPVETHMSWVFLTDAHAYKLKKPVRYDHQDFGTLARRHFYCEEELRLNRKLAPDVYLGLVPLVADTAGRLRVGGDGTVVDWLVKMRRLPADALLDAMLLRGAATPAQMEGVAQRLAAFHRQQPPAPLGPASYRALLLRHIAEYEHEMRGAWSGLPQARIAALCAGQRAMLEHLAPLLDARVTAARIVDGHGDLRPEHVYLGEPPAVIDALEFSAELRWLDGADEVGFLALECVRARAPALGRVLLQAWREAGGDDVPEALVHFYQSCRACSRARLAIRHLREERYRASPVWRRRALRYLALAQRHLRAAGARPAPAAR
jgi:aminoglycoside phosphotransferase family enzyme